MKQLFTMTIAGLLICLLFSFKTIYELKNNSAEVTENNGLLVFSHAIPQKEHRIIGTIKKGFMSTDYPVMFELVEKKIKKTYPTAQGYIVRYDSATYTLTFDVIEFKQN
ncbi:MAG TPA: hypothetical protein VF581_07900 [Flavobacterium sp.]|jgi:hypothetical protein